MVATLYVHAMLFFFQAGNPGASSWDLRSMWSQMSALPVRWSLSCSFYLFIPSA